MFLSAVDFEFFTGIYLNALRAYPATVPTTQYPDCSMCPDVFALCFLLHVRTTSCCVCRWKLCHFFTKARCECLLPLPHGPPNPCQILPKMVPNRRGGTLWRALSAPKRPRGTQERSKRPPEMAKKHLQERLGALLSRVGRVLSVIGASRRSL